MGERVSTERLALTIAEIQDIPQVLLEAAFSEIRRSGKWFPKPGEIREIAYRNPLTRMTFANIEIK